MAAAANSRGRRYQQALTQCVWRTRHTTCSSACILYTSQPGMHTLLTPPILPPPPNTRTLNNNYTQLTCRLLRLPALLVRKSGRVRGAQAAQAPCHQPTPWRPWTQHQPRGWTPVAGFENRFVDSNSNRFNNSIDACHFEAQLNAQLVKQAELSVKTQVVTYCALLVCMLSCTTLRSRADCMCCYVAH